MCLKPLEFGVRIDQRVAIIEPGDVYNVQDTILHAIDPPTTVGPLIGREAKRVRHTARRISIVGQLPKLFDAKTVNLRLALFIEAEPSYQFLRQGAADAF